MLSSPFSPEAFARLRNSPAFRAVVEQHAQANLASYAGLSISERWLMSDLGRSSLTGAAVILDAFGTLTRSSLAAAAAAHRTCSQGRVRAYVRRAVANGFLTIEAADEDGKEAVRVTGRLMAVADRFTAATLRSASRLAPGIQPAVERYADPSFRRSFLRHTGLLSASRPDIFSGPDMPIVLFLGRDGGMRMLEDLICRQDPEREAMLGEVALSRSALARSSLVSRTHVTRLLSDGTASGLLMVTRNRVAASPLLSRDVERHYSIVFELARVAALSALAE